jgi:hypothetical protein
VDDGLVCSPDIDIRKVVGQVGKTLINHLQVPMAIFF